MEKPDDFPLDCWEAFQSVLSAVITRTEKQGSTETVNTDECSCFIEFLKARLTKDEQAEYQSKLDGYHISDKVLKNVKTSGFGRCAYTGKEPLDRAFLAFELSAEYHTTTLLLHFAQYVKDIDGKNTGGLNGHSNAITWLLQTLARSRDAAKKSYAEDVMSKQCFSEGLKKSLKKFNDELQFLTIEQVKALDHARDNTHLWVQGSAGTGKTIFAVEAAYRALRAGLSVLIVYRTRQFQEVFSQLLDSVDRRLSLLLHLDFMYLLRMHELHGADSEQFKVVASELTPKVKLESEHLFDLIIVDDCGTYETQMPSLIKYLDQMAYKKIILAAPEQVLDNITFDFSEEETDRLLPNKEILGFIGQDLNPPNHYFPVSLEKNIRNASLIVDYTNKLFEKEFRAGIVQDGWIKTTNTNWQDLSESLLSICSEILKFFPADRLKILVDPGIVYPPLQSLSLAEYEAEFDRLIHHLPSLTQAVLLSSRDGHFLHSTFECEQDHIHDLQTQVQSNNPFFIYTDGENLGAVMGETLDNVSTYNDFSMAFDHREILDIDAKKLLKDSPLKDPLQIENAILIYPVPLFIGLETDVVIYIRNKLDAEELQIKGNADLLSKIHKVRNTHHFLAMSRAKYALFDVLVC